MRRRKDVSRRLLVLVACVAVWALQAVAVCGGEERLLQGFEKEHLAGYRVRAPKSKRFLWREEEGVIRFGRDWSYRGGYTWYFNLRLVASGAKKTEGEYALRAEIPVCDGFPLRPDPMTRRNWAILASYVGAGDVQMNEFELLFPRDWSGYDLLRVDVQVERPETGYETQLQIRLADGMVDPPLCSTYEVPAGKWVTLEFDLERAVKERGLNLKEMGFFLLVMGPKQRFRPPRSRRDVERAVVWVDNIRLAKKGAPCRYPVLKDDTSFEVKAPRAYAVAYRVGKEKGRKKIVGWRSESLYMPERVEKKERIEGPFECRVNYEQMGIMDVERVGPVALVSSKEMLVVVFTRGYKVKGILRGKVLVHDRSWAALVLATVDGGRVWKLLGDGSGDEKVFVSQHGGVWGYAIDGDVYVFSDWGCWGTGHSYPIDKGFCRRTVYTGGGWWVSPFYFVDSFQLHCLGRRGVKVMKDSSSGRLYVAWCPSWDWRGGGVYVKYSEDGGRTWLPWHGDAGRRAVVPGMPAGQIGIVPWKEGVMLLVRKGRGRAYMSVFDGKGWEEPRGMPAIYRFNAVSAGGKVYVAGYLGKGSGVWVYDGKEWKKELSLSSVSSKKKGMGPQLVVSGDKVACFDVSKDEKKVLCWVREEGTWKGPRVVAEEKTWVRFSVPRQAPPGFVPVAYIVGEEEAVIKKLIADGANPRKVRRKKPWIYVRVMRVGSR